MSAIRAEPYPAAITHILPDDTHAAHINCWCHPRPTNGPANGTTCVEHTKTARPYFWAEKTT
jgi:hypothetical protein